MSISAPFAANWPTAPNWSKRCAAWDTAFGTPIPTVPCSKPTEFFPAPGALLRCSAPLHCSDALLRCTAAHAMPWALRHRRYAVTTGRSEAPTEPAPVGNADAVSERHLNLAKHASSSALNKTRPTQNDCRENSASATDLPTAAELGRHGCDRPTSMPHPAAAPNQFGRANGKPQCENQRLAVSMAMPMPVVRGTTGPRCPTNELRFCRSNGQALANRHLANQSASSRLVHRPDCRPACRDYPAQRSDHVARGRGQSKVPANQCSGRSRRCRRSASSCRAAIHWRVRPRIEKTRSRCGRSNECPTDEQSSIHPAPPASHAPATAFLQSTTEKFDSSASATESGTWPITPAAQRPLVAHQHAEPAWPPADAGSQRSVASKATRCRDKSTSPDRPACRRTSLRESPTSEAGPIRRRSGNLRNAMPAPAASASR